MASWIRSEGWLPKRVLNTDRAPIWTIGALRQLIGELQLAEPQ